MTSLQTEFGLYVRSIREKQNLSLSDVSHGSGISTSQISRIENGQRGIPKPQQVMNLAKGLRIPYEDLLEKAGYFKGLSEDHLMQVKDHFSLHRELDDKIETYIDTISDQQTQSLKKHFFNEIVNLIEKYFDEEELQEYDVIYTPEALKSIIKKRDFTDEDKKLFVNDFDKIILNAANSVADGTEFAVNIDKLEDYKLEFNGKILEVNEVLRVKDFLVAALKLNN